ncbi:MAG: hypothetical protein KIT11_03365 [Fimbriimonadaceae bacterium]|nr:hypothetical protein [Fimbriimonadaceae bacterium]QYK57063.1 MAG: hypothetical protein KF733_06160 [Fimbriimonadaceae bacterium]
MRHLVWAMALCWILVGCQPRMLVGPQDSVGGYRAEHPVSVALINRTDAELVVYPYVWASHESFRTEMPVRLVPPSAASGGGGRASQKAPLFQTLSMPEHEIGAYSIEVMSDELDVRLAVIDLSREEMEQAQDSNNLRVVFRKDHIDLSLAGSTRRLEWLRKPPSMRVRIVDDGPSAETSLDGN